MGEFVLETHHPSRRITDDLSSINTRIGSSVWDELGQRRVVRLIICPGFV